VHQLHLISVFLTQRPRFPDDFLINPAPTPTTYPLPLHDALPISSASRSRPGSPAAVPTPPRSCAPRTRSTSFRSTTTSCARSPRSEEHTSELQSRSDLVCRLLLEKKKSVRVEIKDHNGLTLVQNR